MNNNVTFIQERTTAHLLPALISELQRWRPALRRLKLIGQDASKYEGLAYGNLSQRLNKNEFVITGSQTSGLENVTEKHFVIVRECKPRENYVRSEGIISASCESMTHATIYATDSSIKFVFHVHSPHLWKLALAGNIFMTRNARYSSPDGAAEVARCFKETNVSKERIFAMGGHLEGIMSFGETADEAGERLLHYF